MQVDGKDMERLHNCTSVGGDQYLLGMVGITGLCVQEVKLAEERFDLGFRVWLW